MPVAGTGGGPHCIIPITTLHTVYRIHAHFIRDTCLAWEGRSCSPAWRSCGRAEEGPGSRPPQRLWDPEWTLCPWGQSGDSVRQSGLSPCHWPPSERLWLLPSLNPRVALLWPARAPGLDCELRAIGRASGTHCECLVWAHLCAPRSERRSPNPQELRMWPCIERGLLIGEIHSNEATRVARVQHDQ